MAYRQRLCITAWVTWLQRRQLSSTMVVFDGSLYQRRHCHRFSRLQRSDLSRSRSCMRATICVRTTCTKVSTTFSGLFGLLGMMIMISANSLLTMYLNLEYQSGLRNSDHLSLICRIGLSRREKQRDGNATRFLQS